MYLRATKREDDQANIPCGVSGMDCDLDFVAYQGLQKYMDSEAREQTQFDLF